VPAAYFLRGKPAARAALGEQTVVGALRQAAGHRPFRLLMCGYFVCGFQLAFITGISRRTSTTRGCTPRPAPRRCPWWACSTCSAALWFGVQGDRRSKKLLLAAIYLTRGLAIVAFVLTPLSVVTALAFAVVMGFTWLSTVPLTTGLVAQMFGPRYLATLGGLVFCGHQVGSFLGVWLAGRIYDRTGSYLLVWSAAAALSFAAAVLHARLDDRPAEPAVEAGRRA
jgi:hypothetical protein